MSKLTDKINELASTEEKTVVVKRDDIENELRRVAEEKTVVDEKPVLIQRSIPRSRRYCERPRAM